MKFKPEKSGSMSLRKRNVNQNINFNVGGQRIPQCDRRTGEKFGTLV